jgi:hypothetical protein
MADNFGLNKLARLQAKRKEAAKNKEPLPLNPDFPYGVVGFDIAFFGIKEWSDEKEGDVTL